MEEGNYIQSKETAENLKNEANKEYSKGHYNLAIEKYTQGIYSCPKEENRLLSILHSNRAACHINLDNLDAGLIDSNDAIQFDNEYPKGYLRRFTILEKKEKWHDALKDINKAFELDENLKVDQKLVARQKRVEKLSSELFEKEKGEMLGKLKDFGNMVLGKVGLSLDNFQVEKNPDSGSYNIQFKQN
ncbi:hypothetical protein cand_009160 [Cryptosporidium andersoni]|uniref:Uncharacterized protein n=1 Tax=Cryptosporidium andersoni TaxID=117008 RepID=A0A1J4MT45_9CRYT|nr:hypothetical protein cand_009160 [Cryptosporidium andersoni]